MRERVAAWYVTGPLGHFVSGVIDWVALLVKLGAARTRARVRGRP
jgi:hypothetical protein